MDLDLDGNGQADDVDTDATNANLQNAITTWAASGGTEDVVVYLVDHGGSGSFRMSATETLSAAELDGWLDTLQSSITGTLTVVYEACQSGSFAAALAPTAGQSRIVITSTDLGENAYFLSQGTISFSIFFWTHVFNGANVLDAYTLANEAMTQAIDTQHPQYAASAGLANTFIGNGTVIQGEAPVIGAVSAGQTITGTSTATLWADPVTDTDGIARVWAVLRPPNFQSLSPDNPVQELPTFDLQPLGAGRYEASYDGFNAPGLYQIAIYARDRIGNTSVPELTTISVNSPLKRKAIIVGGGRQPDPVWPSYENALGRAYNALKVQGYTDNTIAFRSPVTFTAGVDGAPSLSNIEYLIKTWGTFDTYDLVIYFVGPASGAGFEINAVETLTPAQLDAWVDIAQYTIPGIVTVVMDATDSGTFLNQLSPPANTQRITLASTRPGETARFLSGGDLSFDTGNGIGNEKLDGVLARSHVIGAGIQLAGDDPVIGDAGTTPASLSSGTTATVWADDVTTTGAIDFVTATIMPPGGGSPVQVALANVGGGRYEAAYNRFTHYGDYQISVVAVDTEGGTSLPAERSLTQQLGADPYEVDDTLAQARTTGIFGEMTRHNFHDLGDFDWLRFWAQAGEVITMETLNLEANCDTEIALFYPNGSAVMDAGFPVVDDDGSAEPFASYYILTIPQGSYYYLRVRFSPGGSGAGYGLGTGYDVRVSQDVVGCLASANLTVYALSGGTKISGATVTIAVTPAGGVPYSEVATTNGNGEAIFPTLSDEGSYSIQVTKSGYQPFNTSQSVSCGDSASVDAPLTATNPGAVLGLSPGSLEYGQVALGVHRDLTLTVTNTGTGTLSGSASTSGVFSIQGGNTYSLTAGQSRVLTVRFTPSAAQTYNSTLTLTGGSGATAALTGSGFNPAAGVLGDVNTDTQINALDATLINLYLLYAHDESALNAQLATLGMNPFVPNLADVDRAGSGNGITARDATLVNLEQLMGRSPLNAYLATIAQPSSHAGEPVE
ncbi:MAG: carboxypeptidase regulatory-like domain-containing protein [Candidatus Hydrogenedentes bacterium]|nr:carboxypeptidase regulatory-like domain-containing protein [Candidatus Hydrogenedentota bacterium]